MRTLSARQRWWSPTAAVAIGDVVFALVFVLVDELLAAGLFLLLALTLGLAREAQRRAFREGWRHAHESPARRAAPEPWDAG